MYVSVQQGYRVEDKEARGRERRTITKTIGRREVGGIKRGEKTKHAANFLLFSNHDDTFVPRAYRNCVLCARASISVP